MNSIGVLMVVIFSAICIKVETKASTAKCKVPIVAPRNIAKVINKCQDEIKTALLSEAAQLLKEDDSDFAHSRRKREAFSDDERRIAGCLLQCVYRKMKAVSISRMLRSEFIQ